jgi:hypothetical protein
MTLCFCTLSRTRAWPRAWWAVACLGLWSAVGAALAGTGAAGPDPLAIIERLPADVQVVLRINKADRQRQSAPGRALARAAREASLFADTGRAWANLAARLGWEPDDAFARLAGRRIILAIAEPAPDGRRSWAVLSDVDDRAERALLKGLAAAPRLSIAGHPVRSIEDGRFELAVFHHPEAGGGRAGESCTLILAPASSGEFLDRIVRSMAGEPIGPVLADSPVLEVAAPLLSGDVFFMARGGEAQAGAYLAVSATLVKDGWDAKILASPGMLLSDQGADQGGEIEKWSAGAIDQLAEHAIGIVISSGMAGLDRWLPMLTLPTLPEAADRLRGLVGGRVMLGMFRLPDAQGRPSPNVALSCAFDSPDTDLLAGPADAVLARLIGAVEAGAGAGDDDRPDFDGFLPEVPRVVPLTGPVASLWKPLVGTNPQLAWVYRAEKRPPGGGSRPGWWMIGLVPADQEIGGSAWISTSASALAADEGGDDQRARITTGFVRLADLAKWMSQVRADPKGAMAPLTFIETARWDAWLAPTGLVEGTLRLRTVPPP